MPVLHRAREKSNQHLLRMENTLKNDNQNTFRKNETWPTTTTYI